MENAVLSDLRDCVHEHMAAALPELAGILHEIDEFVQSAHGNLHEAETERDLVKKQIVSQYNYLTTMAQELASTFQSDPTVQDWQTQEPATDGDADPGEADAVTPCAP